MSYPEANGNHAVPKLAFDVPVPKTSTTVPLVDPLEVPTDAHTDQQFCVEYYTVGGFIRLRVFGPFESQRECDAFTSARSELFTRAGLTGFVASTSQIDPAKVSRTEFVEVSDPLRGEAAASAEGPFTVTFVADGAKPERVGSFGPFDTHALAKDFMTGARGQALARRLGATDCSIDRVITNVASAITPTDQSRYLVVSTRKKEGKIVSRHAYGFFGSWDEANDFAWNKLPGGSLQPGQTLSINIVEPPG